ncbi:MAG TPA: hypothetical protein VGN52_16665 [Burkholderiales bacterium]
MDDVDTRGRRARRETAAALRAGVIGSIAGVAAGGLTYSLLAPGRLWLRAAISGGAAAATGGLAAWLALYLLLRKPP